MSNYACFRLWGRFKCVGDEVAALAKLAYLYALLLVNQTMAAKQFVVQSPSIGHGCRIPFGQSLSKIGYPVPACAAQIIVYRDNQRIGIVLPIFSNKIDGLHLVDQRYIGFA